MPTPIDNPVSKIFESWSEQIKPTVGKGHCSMGVSSTPAKMPYAAMTLISNIGTDYDLEGNECATSPSFQIESFAEGQKAITKAYNLDSASHKIMTEMGFRRVYGPEMIDNVDSRIKRVISRYSRIYTGQL